MRTSIICLLISIATLASNAQIGYQVSLLDPETGAPRANQSVTVTIDITDSEGANIISDTQTATTNEFGILSLKVGTADSFANMDWNRLPMWISATVGGVVIGKSQILNVPVAEYAKTTGTLTSKTLCAKKWRPMGRNVPVMTFKTDGSGYLDYNDESLEHFKYYLDGNTVMIEIKHRYVYDDGYAETSYRGGLLNYNASTKHLYGTLYDFTEPWE